eukprot:894339-Lingulodinium_polyedra.AAC.2
MHATWLALARGEKQPASLTHRRPWHWPPAYGPSQVATVTRDACRLRRPWERLRPAARLGA